MKRKLTLWQLLGLVAASAPILYFSVPAIHGLLFGSPMFTLSYGITFLILPLVTSVLLYALVLWRKKKVLTRVILAAVVLVLAYFALIFSVLIGDFRNQSIYSGGEALSHYAGLAYPEGMPSAESLGAPDDALFMYYRRSCAIFRSDCDSLILTYSPEEYAARTAELDRQDLFHTKPLSTQFHTPEVPLYPEFDWEGWHLRYLKMDGTPLCYPTEMVLVGTNDRESSIAWIYFTDFDLDWISSHEDFLLEDCGWQHLPENEKRK